jgi:hypothetical protein
MPAHWMPSSSALKEQQSNCMEVDREERDERVDVQFQRQLDPDRVESYIRVNQGISFTELIAYFRSNKESVEGILVNVSFWKRLPSMIQLNRGCTL